MADRYVPLGPFTGGILRRASPQLVPRTYFDDLLNVSPFLQPGVLSTRPGTRALTLSAPTAIGADQAQIVAFRFFRPTLDASNPLTPEPAASEMFATLSRANLEGAAEAGTGIFSVWNATTGRMVYRLTGLSAMTGYPNSGNWCRWTMMREHNGFLYVNPESVAPLLRFSARSGTADSEVRRAGFPAPTVAPTVDPPAVGADPVRRYVYTYVYASNPARESSRSPISTNAKGTTDPNAPANVTVTVPALGAPTVPPHDTITDVVVYRTMDGQTGPFHRVKRITIAAALAGDVDNSLDSQIGPELAPDDNNLPPDLALFEFWNSRMFVVDREQPNRLRFSAVSPHPLDADAALGVHGAHPEIFPDLFFTDVGGQGPITALVPWANRLWIFKDHEIYSLVGSSVEDFSVVKVADVGCVGPNAVAATSDGIYFVGADDHARCFFFDGAGAQPISFPIDEILRADTDMTLVPVFAPTGYDNTDYAGPLRRPVVTFSSVVRYRDEIWFVIPRTTTNNHAPTAGSAGLEDWPENVRIYVYSTVAKSWTIYEPATRGFAVHAVGTGWGGSRPAWARRAGDGAAANVLCVAYRPDVSTDTLTGAWADPGTGFALTEGFGAIPSRVTWGRIALAVEFERKHLRWMHLLTNLTGVTVNVRRAWDSEALTHANVTGQRSTSFVAELATGQIASRQIRWQRIVGLLSGDYGNSMDQGYWVQPSVDWSGPLSIYAVALTISPQEPVR